MFPGVNSLPSKTGNFDFKKNTTETSQLIPFLYYLVISSNITGNDYKLGAEEIDQDFRDLTQAVSPGKGYAGYKGVVRDICLQNERKLSEQTIVETYGSSLVEVGDTATIRFKQEQYRLLVKKVIQSGLTVTQLESKQSHPLLDVPQIGAGAFLLLKKTVLEIRRKIKNQVPDETIISELASEQKLTVEPQLISLVKEDIESFQARIAALKVEEEKHKKAEQKSLTALTFASLPAIVSALVEGKSSSPSHDMAWIESAQKSLTAFRDSKEVMAALLECKGDFASSVDTDSLLEKLKVNQKALEFTEQYLKTLSDRNLTSKHHDSGNRRQRDPYDYPKIVHAQMVSIEEALEQGLSDAVIMQRLGVRRDEIENVIDFIGIDRAIRASGASQVFTGDNYANLRDQIAIIRGILKRGEAKLPNNPPPVNQEGGVFPPLDIKPLPLTLRPPMNYVPLMRPVLEASRTRALESGINIWPFGMDPARLDGEFEGLMQRPMRESLYLFFKPLFDVKPNETPYRETLLKLIEKKSQYAEFIISQLLFAGKPYPGHQYALAALFGLNPLPFIKWLQLQLNAGKKENTAKVFNFILVHWRPFLDCHKQMDELTTTGFFELIKVFKLYEDMAGRIQKGVEKDSAKIAAVKNLMAQRGKVLCKLFRNSISSFLNLLTPSIDQEGATEILTFLIEEGILLDFIHALCSHPDTQNYHFVCHQILLNQLLQMDSAEAFKSGQPLFNSFSVMQDAFANVAQGWWLEGSSTILSGMITPGQHPVIEMIIERLPDEKTRRTEASSISSPAETKIRVPENKDEEDSGSVAKNSRMVMGLVSPQDLSPSLSKLEPLPLSPTRRRQLFPAFIYLANCLLNHAIRLNSTVSVDGLKAIAGEYNRYFEEIMAKGGEEYGFLFILAIAQAPVKSSQGFATKKRLLVNFAQFLGKEPLQFICKKLSKEQSIREDDLFNQAANVLLWDALSLDFAESMEKRVTQVKRAQAIGQAVKNLMEIFTENLNVPPQSRHPLLFQRIAEQFRELESRDGLEELWQMLRFFAVRGQETLPGHRLHIAAMFIFLFFPSKLEQQNQLENSNGFYGLNFGRIFQQYISQHSENCPLSIQLDQAAELRNRQKFFFMQILLDDVVSLNLKNELSAFIIEYFEPSFLQTLVDEIAKSVPIEHLSSQHHPARTFLQLHTIKRHHSDEKKREMIPDREVKPSLSLPFCIDCSSLVLPFDFYSESEPCPVDYLFQISESSPVGLLYFFKIIQKTRALPYLLQHMASWENDSPERELLATRLNQYRDLIQTCSGAENAKNCAQFLLIIYALTLFLETTQRSDYSSERQRVLIQRLGMHVHEGTFDPLPPQVMLLLADSAENFTDREWQLNATMPLCVNYSDRYKRFMGNIARALLMNGLPASFFLLGFKKEKEEKESNLSEIYPRKAEFFSLFCDGVFKTFIQMDRFLQGDREFDEKNTGPSSLLVKQKALREESVKFFVSLSVALTESKKLPADAENLINFVRTSTQQHLNLEQYLLEKLTGPANRRFLAFFLETQPHSPLSKGMLKVIVQTLIKNIFSLPPYRWENFERQLARLILDYYKVYKDEVDTQLQEIQQRLYPSMSIAGFLNKIFGLDLSAENEESLSVGKARALIVKEICKAIGVPLDNSRSSWLMRQFIQEAQCDLAKRLAEGAEFYCLLESPAAIIASMFSNDLPAELHLLNVLNIETLDDKEIQKRCSARGVISQEGFLEKLQFYLALRFGENVATEVKSTPDYSAPQHPQRSCLALLGRNRFPSDMLPSLRLADEKLAKNELAERLAPIAETTQKHYRILLRETDFVCLEPIIDQMILQLRLREMDAQPLLRRIPDEETLLAEIQQIYPQYEQKAEDIEETVAQALLLLRVARACRSSYEEKKPLAVENRVVHLAQDRLIASLDKLLQAAAGSFMNLQNREVWHSHYRYLLILVKEITPEFPASNSLLGEINHVRETWKGRCDDSQFEKVHLFLSRYCACVTQDIEKQAVAPEFMRFLKAQPIFSRQPKFISELQADSNKLNEYVYHTMVTLPNHFNGYCLAKDCIDQLTHLNNPYQYQMEGQSLLQIFRWHTARAVQTEIQLLLFHGIQKCFEEKSVAEHVYAKLKQLFHDYLHAIPESNSCWEQLKALNVPNGAQIFWSSYLVAFLAPLLPQISSDDWAIFGDKLIAVHSPRQDKLCRTLCYELVLAYLPFNQQKTIKDAVRIHFLAGLTYQPADTQNVPTILQAMSICEQACDILREESKDVQLFNTVVIAIPNQFCDLAVAHNILRTQNQSAKTALLFYLIGILPTHLQRARDVAEQVLGVERCFEVELRQSIANKIDSERWFSRAPFQLSVDARPQNIADIFFAFIDDYKTIDRQNHIELVTRFRAIPWQNRVPAHSWMAQIMLINEDNLVEYRAVFQLYRDARDFLAYSPKEVDESKKSELVSQFYDRERFQRLYKEYMGMILGQLPRSADPHQTPRIIYSQVVKLKALIALEKRIFGVKRGKSLKRRIVKGILLKLNKKIAALKVVDFARSERVKNYIEFAEIFIKCWYPKFSEPIADHLRHQNLDRIFSDPAMRQRWRAYRWENVQRVSTLASSCSQFLESKADSHPNHPLYKELSSRMLVVKPLDESKFSSMEQALNKFLTRCFPTQTLPPDMEMIGPRRILELILGALEQLDSEEFWAQSVNLLESVAASAEVGFGGFTPQDRCFAALRRIIANTDVSEGSWGRLLLSIYLPRLQKKFEEPDDLSRMIQKIKTDLQWLKRELAQSPHARDRSKYLNELQYDLPGKIRTLNRIIAMDPTVAEKVRRQITITIQELNAQSKLTQVDFIDALMRQLNGMKATAQKNRKQELIRSFEIILKAAGITHLKNVDSWKTVLGVDLVNQLDILQKLLLRCDQLLDYFNVVKNPLFDQSVEGIYSSDNLRTDCQKLFSDHDISYPITTGVRDIDLIEYFFKFFLTQGFENDEKEVISKDFSKLKTKLAAGDPETFKLTLSFIFSINHEQAVVFMKALLLSWKPLAREIIFTSDHPQCAILCARMRVVYEIFASSGAKGALIFDATDELWTETLFELQHLLLLNNDSGDLDLLTKMQTLKTESGAMVPWIMPTLVTNAQRYQVCRLRFNTLGRPFPGSFAEDTKPVSEGKIIVQEKPKLTCLAEGKDFDEKQRGFSPAQLLFAVNEDSLPTSRSPADEEQLMALCEQMANRFSKHDLQARISYIITDLERRGIRRKILVTAVLRGELRKGQGLLSRARENAKKSTEDNIFALEEKDFIEAAKYYDQWSREAATTKKGISSELKSAPATLTPAMQVDFKLLAVAHAFYRQSGYTKKLQAIYDCLCKVKKLSPDSSLDIKWYFVLRFIIGHTNEKISSVKEAFTIWGIPLSDHMVSVIKGFDREYSNLGSRAAHPERFIHLKQGLEMLADNKQISSEERSASLHEDPGLISNLKSWHSKDSERIWAAIKKMDFPELNDYADWYYQLLWINSLLPEGILEEQWGEYQELLVAIGERCQKLFPKQRRHFEAVVLHYSSEDLDIVDGPLGPTVVSLLEMVSRTGKIIRIAGKPGAYRLNVDYVNFSKPIFQSLPAARLFPLAGQGGLIPIEDEKQIPYRPWHEQVDMLLNSDYARMYLLRLLAKEMNAQLPGHLFRSQFLDPEELAKTAWEILAKGISPQLCFDQELKAETTETSILYAHLQQLRVEIGKAPIKCLREILAIFKDTLREQGAFILYQKLVAWAVRQCVDDLSPDLIEILKLSEVLPLTVQELYLPKIFAGITFASGALSEQKLSVRLAEQQPAFTQWTLIEDYLQSRIAKRKDSPEPFPITQMIDWHIEAKEANPDEMEKRLKFFDHPAFDEDVYSMTSFIAVILRELGINADKEIVTFNDMTDGNHLPKQLITYLNRIIRYLDEKMPPEPIEEGEEVESKYDEEKSVPARGKEYYEWLDKRERLKNFVKMLAGIPIELVHLEPGERLDHLRIDKVKANKLIYVINIQNEFDLAICVYKPQEGQFETRVENGIPRQKQKLEPEYVQAKLALDESSLMLLRSSEAQSHLDENLELRDNILRFADSILGRNAIPRSEAWPEGEEKSTIMREQEVTRGFCTHYIPRPSQLAGELASYLQGYTLFLVQDFNPAEFKASDPNRRSIVLTNNMNAFIIFGNQPLIKVTVENRHGLGFATDEKMVKQDSPQAARLIADVTSKGGYTYLPDFDISPADEKVLVHGQRWLDKTARKWYEQQLRLAIAHKMFRYFYKPVLENAQVREIFNALIDVNWLLPLRIDVAFLAYKDFIKQCFDMVSNLRETPQQKFDKILPEIEAVLDIKMTACSLHTNVRCLGFQSMAEIFLKALDVIIPHIFAKALELPRHRSSRHSTDYAHDLNIANHYRQRESEAFPKNREQLVDHINSMHVFSLLISKLPLPKHCRLTWMAQLPEKYIQRENLRDCYVLIGPETPPALRFTEKGGAGWLSNFYYVDNEQIVWQVNMGDDKIDRVAAEFNVTLRKIHEKRSRLDNHKLPYSLDADEYQQLIKRYQAQTTGSFFPATPLGNLGGCLTLRGCQTPDQVPRISRQRLMPAPRAEESKKSLPTPSEELEEFRASLDT